MYVLDYCTYLSITTLLPDNKIVKIVLLLRICLNHIHAFRYLHGIVGFPVIELVYRRHRRLLRHASSERATTRMLRRLNDGCFTGLVCLKVRLEKIKLENL